MQKNIAAIQAISINPWFVVISGAASIVAFAAYIYEKFDPKFGALPLVVAVFVALLFLFSVFYSLSVRLENIALREVAPVFYEINLIYKKSLHESFHSDDPTYDQAALIEEEKEALHSICQRIEGIYSRLINRKCMVTVKLVTQSGNSKFAHAYTRSQDRCIRDTRDPERAYKIGDGSNLGLDEALRPRKDMPEHFFSADLRHEDGYTNERQDYYRHYKSAIVVPIRSEIKMGDEYIDNHIGYLCVDTKSTHRLNNGLHVYILSSLAQQMYNYMSLMRGEYMVMVWRSHIA